MAEEREVVKKTTTKKKKAVEETKVEKKFCTKCGKELNLDEVCTCDTKSINVNIDFNEILNVSKGFFNKIVNMFKKPTSTLKDETNNSSLKYALIMLSVIAITFGLYIMGGFSSIFSSLSGMTDTNINEFIDIPYFKIFIYMTLIYFLISFIPIGITYLFARLTGNKEFDLKKSISLFAYSNAPVIFSNLLMLVLSLINILSWVGTIIGCVVSVFCFFNYILGFLEYVKVNEDKKAYSLTVIIVAWIVATVLIISLFGGSFVKDITADFGIKDSAYNDIYNSFNW